MVHYINFNEPDNNLNQSEPNRSRWSVRQIDRFERQTYNVKLAQQVSIFQRGPVKNNKWDICNLYLVKINRRFPSIWVQVWLEVNQN